jgi:hypothetical protein
MGAMFQNYSTSPWITDGFVILPFWPQDSIDTGSPWDSQVSTSGTWEANTTILHTDLVCTELSLKKKDRYLRLAREGEENYEDGAEIYLASVLIESYHGCQFNLTVDVFQDSLGDDLFSSDWVSWSDINDIFVGDHQSGYRFARNHHAIVRLNEDCHEDEIIIMATPWWFHDDFTPVGEHLNMTMLAYACHSDYSMATIPVRATAASNALSVEFDEDLFF